MPYYTQWKIGQQLQGIGAGDGASIALGLFRLRQLNPINSPILLQAV